MYECIKPFLENKMSSFEEMEPLREPNKSGGFSAILYKGNNVCDFLSD